MGQDEIKRNANEAMCDALAYYDQNRTRFCELEKHGSLSIALRLVEISEYIVRFLSAKTPAEMSAVLSERRYNETLDDDLNEVLIYILQIKTQFKEEFDEIQVKLGENDGSGGDSES